MTTHSFREFVDTTRTTAPLLPVVDTFSLTVDMTGTTAHFITLAENFWMNLEQRIDIKFCMNIGKSSSESLVLLK